MNMCAFDFIQTVSNGIESHNFVEKTNGSKLTKKCIFLKVYYNAKRSNKFHIKIDRETTYLVHITVEIFIFFFHPLHKAFWTNNTGFLLLIVNLHTINDNKTSTMCTSNKICTKL